MFFCKLTHPSSDFQIILYETGETHGQDFSRCANDSRALRAKCPRRNQEMVSHPGYTYLEFTPIYLYRCEFGKTCKMNSALLLFLLLLGARCQLDAIHIGLQHLQQQVWAHSLGQAVCNHGWGMNPYKTISSAGYLLVESWSSTSSRSDAWWLSFRPRDFYPAILAFCQNFGIQVAHTR